MIVTCTRKVVSKVLYNINFKGSFQTKMENGPISLTNYCDLILRATPSKTITGKEIHSR